MMHEWSHTEADYPREKCIHELFEAQVARKPDAVAVVFENRQLTYRQLNRRANQLAHYLRSLTVGPEVLVGICVERSLDMVVGILGTLKAGGAYVPLDPAYPNARLAHILEDAGARVVLTHGRLAKRLSEHGVTILQLDSEWENVNRLSDRDPKNTTIAENLAYVIYTSGSTGKPKGVQVSHLSVVNLFKAINPLFQFDDTDVWTAVHSYSFDISVWEIWGALFNGGRLIVVPAGVTQSAPALSELIKKEGVTVLNHTPTALRQLTEAKEKAAGLSTDLRLIICGGDVFPRDLAFASITWSVPVWNFYGPTEATVWSTMSKVEPIDAQAETIPIGRPIANTRVYLLDQSLNAVPTGVGGELYISGKGLARGYVNRAELTAEKFVPDPFNDQPGARLYRTGDLARYLSDGSIEFLGRIDDQVKIRGFRIELREIETILAQHPGVEEVVVLAREEIRTQKCESFGVESRKIENGKSDKRLVAYVVRRKDAPITTGDLRRFLTIKLPEYMLPSVFVFMEALPLNHNGKVDRDALPAPSQSRPDLEVPFAIARTSIEEVLADTWAEVLRLNQVGIHDDFFDLGGHSLTATTIVSRVRDSLEVDVPLKCLFANPTVARLAKIIEKSRSGGRNLCLRPIHPVSREHPLRLSFSQERVWFIQQLDPENLAYNFQATLRFRGRLDVAALEHSLNEIVRRHEIFRTTFPAVDGRPFQIIHPVQPAHFEVVNLQSFPKSARESEAQHWIRAELQKPFDVTQIPLIRWHLLQLSIDESVLLHVEHHLVHDGWSFRIFLRELIQLYNAFSAGKPSPLAELSVQFADFACWQRQWLRDEIVEPQLAYWKQKLAGCPVLALPTDRPRPAAQTYRGEAPRIEISRPHSESLRFLGRREGATLFMTMLAAFVALLHRYTGEADICIGSSVANRCWRETEGLIGMIVNTVVLRFDLSSSLRFPELLGQVQEEMLGAFAHQDLPFEQIVQALQPERDLSRNPLFQVMFNFHDAPMPDLELPGGSVDLVEVLSNGSAKFDLNVTVIPRVRHEFQGPESDGMTMIWEYNSDLFESDTIARMIDHFQTLLEGIVTNPDRRISKLPVLSERERHQLLVEWNDTQREYSKDKCVHELFEAQVERNPDAVAVIFQDQQLTYRELNGRANQLGQYLRKHGVGPEVLVGVCVKRSLEMVVALLGILKAGGAYVPLDPEYPKERLGFILEDTQATVLLTQARLVEKLPSSNARLVRLDRDWGEIAEESDENLINGTTAESLAYVVYTSGSTGQPKGVEVLHRGVLRLLFGVEYVQLNANETFLHLAPTSFDASTFEIWGALLHGAKCVLFPGKIPSPSDIGDILHHHKISTLWLTASLFNTVIDEAPEALSGVRQLLIGGEALSVPHVRRAVALLPHTQIINGYGPTESTTFACCCRIPPQLDESISTISIGRPIANTEVYLLDSHLFPVPIGVPGELYIGGDGLARGYLNRPELTAEKFIPNAFSNELGTRLYGTGDLARYLADGNIEFLGRIDHQVKIRGFRIELGEIESVLGQHPGVREAVVLAREDTPADKRLAAYVVPREGPCPTSNGLRGFLEQKLPKYMVPSAFVFLDILPLTPNGKADRKALPAPDGNQPEIEERYVAPRSATEELLAEIWAEVLKLDKVGVHDNFFELGGHSLLATRIISRLRAALRLDLPLRSLFECPTIASLAQCIEVLSWAGEKSRVPVDATASEREEMEL